MCKELCVRKMRHFSPLFGRFSTLPAPLLPSFAPQTPPFSLLRSPLRTAFGSPLERPLPLQEELHERRIGTNVRPARPQHLQRLIARPALPPHQIRGQHHAATADTVAAVNEHRASGGPLRLD